MTAEHRLIAALKQVRHELLIPAAEYVPAIPACWEIIDQALAASPSVGGFDWLVDQHIGWLRVRADCLDEQAEPGDVENAAHFRRVAEAIATLSAPPPPSVSTGSRPQEAVPTEQAEPAFLDMATWSPLDDNGLAEVRVNGQRITSMPSYAGAEEVAERINRALQIAADFLEDLPTPQPADGCSSNEGAA